MIIPSVVKVGLHEAVLTEVAAEEGIDLNTITNAQRDTITKKAKDRYLAMCFILGADRTRYGRLIENMENSFLQGQDTYPKTVNNAYNLIANWKQDPRNLMRAIGSINDGITFTTTTEANDDATTLTTSSSIGKGDKGKNKGKQSKSHIKCFKCNTMGHYSNECPNEEITSDIMLMDGIEDGEFNETGFSCLQHGNDKNINNNKQINPMWMLLDSCSTVNIFYNKDMLTNIRKTNATMTIHCNAGLAKTNYIGDYEG